MIRFDNVHKAFGANEVLRGFSLEVKEGETMVIIGYSGTGKSVAIKHIVGLLEPDEGHVEVDGVTVGALTRRELYRLRSKIGYVFQFAALFDSLTIAENVAMGLRKQGELTETQIAERVRESLRLVDLDDAVGDKLPSELSGELRGEFVTDGVVEVDEAERLTHALGDLRLGELSLLPEPHRDVLGDREGIEEGGELEDVADLRAEAIELTPGQRADGDTVDFDVALIGLEEPDDMLDGHRLAGPRIADDDHRLPLFDLEGEAAQDLVRAERLMDVVEADHGGGAAAVYAAKLPSARPTSPSRRRLSARSRSCRTRSRVTPSIEPISSSVCSRPPSSPK